MDNFQIADTLSLLSKVMDIHGENSFKSKAYSSAAFAVEKYATPFADLPADKMANIKGIGSSSAQKIIEYINTGKIIALDNLIASTPPGVIEMLNIKGIGPKKINTIWKEVQLETIGELQYACTENRLKLYKGFGEKTQQNILDSINFYLQNKGSHLYANVEAIFEEILPHLQLIFPNQRVEVCGNYKRQLETLDYLDFLITADRAFIESTLTNEAAFTSQKIDGQFLQYHYAHGIRIRLYPTTIENITEEIIEKSSSTHFYDAVRKLRSGITEPAFTEQEYFEQMQLPFIPSPYRENPETISTVKQFGKLPEIIQPSDIRGIIHCHTTWSDGGNTIEEMAKAAIDVGLEYIVISDHSKSAGYANGLTEDRIAAQHQEIDELNKKLAPFKIFKGIESDILNDGKLDYADETLAKFDLIIASVHSNLGKAEDKAMMRLLKAIENPYTTILGHMTGRLLLTRNGYPVNHETIIDACADNGVVIELNANPHRLDIDWRHIDYALKKNVLISINPDSHSASTLGHVRYGVIAAGKALLKPANNLSSFSLMEFEKFLAAKRRSRQM